MLDVFIGFNPEKNHSRRLDKFITYQINLKVLGMILKPLTIFSNERRIENISVLIVSKIFDIQTSS